MGEMVGRDEERASIETFLSRGSGLSVLLVEGEPGIGKTTVWREAVRRAEGEGFRVLACRPAEAEMKLGFAALGDLLRDVGDETVTRLPEPQRRALEVALLRTSPRKAPPNPRAVGTALVSTLAQLADAQPVIVAVDDVQWLDRASAAALSFALRRLDDRRLGVLLARRTHEAGADAVDLADVSEDRIDRIRLGSLNLGALYHVIRDRLGLVFPRPTLQRIVQASDGNPYFAIELARALDEAGEQPHPGQPLPVPDSLAALLRARIERLPTSAREALLVAASLSNPTVSLVAEAVGEPAPRSLERARRADVIELREEHIRFTHPLLAAAVLSSALPARRREMHRRLAEVVDGEEERARHLALGVEGADAAIAATLEAAARHASLRGAPDEAAELLELSCRLTPANDGAELGRRRLELARLIHRVGDAEGARNLVDDLLASPMAGPVRARALELRAQIHWVAGIASEAEACCEEALTLTGDDDHLRARILVTFARVTIDAGRVAERARVALDLLETLAEPDSALLSEALTAFVGGEFALGHGVPMDAVERGLELEAVTPPENVSDRMSASLGYWLKMSGDFDGARHWFEVTRKAALDEGDEGSLPYALSHLPQIELWTGNWTQAEARAREHLELADRMSQTDQRLTALYTLSVVRAHLGHVDEARARIEEALVEAERADPWSVFRLLSALGFVELSLGDASAAVAALARSFRIYEESGAGDTPSVFEDYAEALVLAGDLDRAEEIVDLYEARARAGARATTLAPALRARGLLAASLQQLDDAVRSLEEALVQHDAVVMPFSLARTLLVLGQVRRRRGERRAAKEALERALAIFEELGSPLWAEKARAELARVPIRRGSGATLTPAEERVAELVVQGRTNQEVAQALFVSTKTVEANLTRIYRKLGVRSRSALAARLAEREPGEEAAKL